MFCLCPSKEATHAVEIKLGNYQELAKHINVGH
jgi:hypothetical protein